MKSKLVTCLCATLVVSTPPCTNAQDARKIPRVGYMTAASAEIDKTRLAALQQSLQELGYVVGKNIFLEKRHAAGDSEKLVELALELVRLSADALVIHGGKQAVVAAKKATSTIPIIMIAHPDPIGDGLIDSLARPGGQVTGLSDMHSDIITKRLEILKEVLPSATRIGVLLNPETPTQLTQLKDLEAVAPKMGVSLYPLPIAKSDDIARGFSRMKTGNAGGLIVLGDPLLSTYRQQIFDLAVQYRLPAFYSHEQWVAAGGLMAYGTNFPSLWRRAAVYIDKILKGAKPADLPVEQPMKFEFVVNLKTAKQIGLTIPPNVLVRADRVIR